MDDGYQHVVNVVEGPHVAIGYHVVETLEYDVICRCRRQCAGNHVWADVTQAEDDAFKLHATSFGIARFRCGCMPVEVVVCAKMVCHCSLS